MSERVEKTRLLLEVGGRGGASGGRGRLRHRAMQGLVTLSSTPCYLLTRCGGSTSPSASTRPRAVCTCLLGLCGTLQGLVVSLWHFGWPFGSIVAPWASILTHMGYSWEAFGHFGETLGLHLSTLGLHLGILGVHVGVLWALWGVALDPSDHFCGKGFKQA